MQFLTGILFVAAMVLAVILGGQTLDYSWGPALVFLIFSVLCSLAGLRQLRERSWAAWVPIILVTAASAWILYGCFHSPVKEFARSDAMLVGGLLLAFVFGLLLQPSGNAVRLVIAGLAVFGISNLVMVLLQLRDPSISWPFSGRPEKFPSGFFGHYNHLADFAAATSGILSARFLFAKDRVVEKVCRPAGRWPFSSAWPVRIPVAVCSGWPSGSKFWRSEHFSSRCVSVPAALG